MYLYYISYYLSDYIDLYNFILFCIFINLFIYIVRNCYYYYIYLLEKVNIDLSIVIIILCFTTLNLSIYYFSCFISGNDLYILYYSNLPNFKLISYMLIIIFNINFYFI